MIMFSFVSFLYLMLVVFSSPAAKADEAFGYSLTTDLVYGTGKITKGGKVIERDLLMDVYQPFTRLKAQKLPAVILVHGGAFHRGGLRQPPYRELGAVHSGMQDYARLLAPLGYVCFVIEYRLTQELPIPDMAPDAKGLQPYAGLVTEHGLKRTNFARRALGLPEVAPDDGLVVWNGVLAPAEDLNKAVVKIMQSAK